MAEYSSAEVAERAGVDPSYVQRLIALGLLVPRAGDRFSGSDVSRVRIVDALDHSGLPLAALGEAVRNGDLSFDFVDEVYYRRFASFETATFEEVSADTGVPLDLLLVVREAMGFAQPLPGDHIRDDELQVVPLLQLQVREGFRTAVIERALRVYGESLRRVAETEADWFRTEILLPVFRAGGGPVEVGEVTSRLVPDLSRHSDEAVLAIYHGQQANAWMRNIFEGFEGALARAGLHTRLDHPPAICFLDLTGYTRLTSERGDEAAAELAGTLARLVQRTSIEHGGKPVKWLGDGVMFHFAAPGPGVLAALEMVDGAAEAGLPRPHVGLHAGPVLFQEGDYFGQTVNVASRIADYARQGEVLVSQDVVDASTGAELAFAEIGPVELKGIAGPVRLHVARRAG